MWSCSISKSCTEKWVDFRQLRERLEQETGKRSSSEGDHGENLSKVGFICQDKNVFEMLLISEAVEEAEKAGDESAYKDNRGRGENLNHKDFQLAPFSLVLVGKVRLCDGEGCGNPCSLKCHHFMCRQCCRSGSNIECNFLHNLG